jgi:hypothetical protein
MKRPQLTGKPHWPLTTYEKIWGFWHLAGIRLVIGAILFLSFILLPQLAPQVVIFIAANQPLILFFVMAPIFGMLTLFLGLIGTLDWWEVIHGTVPNPGPFARPLAWIMNEPDPYKEQMEMQARLDEAKRNAMGSA